MSKTDYQVRVREWLHEVYVQLKQYGPDDVALGLIQLDLIEDQIKRLRGDHEAS